MFQVIRNPPPHEPDLFNIIQAKKRLSALLSSRLSVLADELYAKVKDKPSKSDKPEFQDPSLDY
jgi:hypothetical protein